MSTWDKDAISPNVVGVLDCLCLVAPNKKGHNLDQVEASKPSSIFGNTDVVLSTWRHVSTKVMKDEATPKD